MQALTPEQQNEKAQKIIAYRQLLDAPAWKEFTAWCDAQAKQKMTDMTLSADPYKVMKINGNLEMLTLLPKWVETRMNHLKHQLDPTQKE